MDERGELRRRGRLFSFKWSGRRVCPSSRNWSGGGVVFSVVNGVGEDFVVLVVIEVEEGTSFKV